MFQHVVPSGSIQWSSCSLKCQACTGPLSLPASLECWGHFCQLMQWEICYSIFAVGFIFLSELCFKEPPLALGIMTFHKHELEISFCKHPWLGNKNLLQGEQ